MFVSYFLTKSDPEKVATLNQGYKPSPIGLKKMTTDLYFPLSHSQSNLIYQKLYYIVEDEYQPKSSPH